MEVNSIEWLKKAKAMGATHCSQQTGAYYKQESGVLLMSIGRRWSKSDMRSICHPELSKIDFSPLDELENIESAAQEDIGEIYIADDHDDLTFHNIEQDPNGINQHSPGAKLDFGKCKAGILLDFSRALKAVADVGTFGANKYSRGGWQSVENAEERYTDAFARHLLEINIGDGKDSQTGMDHLWHAAWNILAVIELKERSKKTQQS